MFKQIFLISLVISSVLNIPCSDTEDVCYEDDQNVLVQLNQWIQSGGGQIYNMKIKYLSPYNRSLVASTNLKVK